MKIELDEKRISLLHLSIVLIVVHCSGVLSWKKNLVGCQLIRWLIDQVVR